MFGKEQCNERNLSLPGLGVVVVGFLLQFGGHPINPGKQEHLATPLLSSHLENKPHGEGAHGSKTYKLSTKKKLYGEIFPL